MNSNIFFHCFPTFEKFNEWNKAFYINKGYSFIVKDNKFYWSFKHDRYNDLFMMPNQENKYKIEIYSQYFYNRMLFLNGTNNKQYTTKFNTFSSLQAFCGHYFSDSTMRWFGCRISNNNIVSVPKLGITLIMLSNKDNHCQYYESQREYKIIAVDHLYDIKQNTYPIYEIQPREHEYMNNYRATKKRFDKLCNKAFEGYIPQICE